MGPHRRAAVLALALVPLGTIAGHLVGYGLAGQHAGLDGSHSHLAPAIWFAAVPAVAALGWLAAARGAGRARLPLAWLAGAQAVLFVAMESGEYLAAGRGLGHLLGGPALRWGLAAQVVTAAALVLVAVVARASGDRVRSLLEGRGRRGRSAAGVPAAAVAVVHSFGLASSASERGPPRTLVSV